MQRETSNDSFLDYGSVYHQPIDREHPEPGKFSDS